MLACTGASAAPFTLTLSNEKLQRRTILVSRARRGRLVTEARMHHLSKTSRRSLLVRMPAPGRRLVGLVLVCRRPTYRGRRPPCTTARTTSWSRSSAFARLSTTPFRWGQVAGYVFCEGIDRAYEVQIHWRKNIFSPPTGHAGTEFVKEHTRLLRAYKDRTP